MSEQLLIGENDQEQCDWVKKKLEEKFKEIKVFRCNGQKENLAEKGGTVKNVPGFVSVKDTFLI
jgi:hypothetical protein